MASKRTAKWDQKLVIGLLDLWLVTGLQDYETMAERLAVQLVKIAAEQW